MSKVSSGFSLVGLMDGTTINGFLRVDNMPLVQRYTKGSDKFTPDFKTLADNNKPTVIAVLRDITNGDVLIPNELTFYYNGMELTFGPDNLCTTVGYEGKFKKLTDYAASIGTAGSSQPTSYNMIALRVMDNLVPLSGYDNDRISVKGFVEVGGQRIAFNELSTDVVIQETTGNQFDVIITNDKGSALTQTGESLTEKAILYRDSVKVTDLAGFTFQWVKETATGDVNLGTAQTQNIATSDIDNKLMVRCDVLQGGSVVASGYDEVSDFSDPYFVQINITGISGNVIRKGQTAVITPVAVKRSTGDVDTTIKQWTFRTKDNKGADFVISGKSSHIFTAETCSISYSDMQKAGMGISGSVEANF